MNEESDDLERDNEYISVGKMRISSEEVSSFFFHKNLKIGTRRLKF
jgi:hypothetical protein